VSRPNALVDEDIRPGAMRILSIVSALFFALFLLGCEPRRGEAPNGDGKQPEGEKWVWVELQAISKEDNTKNTYTYGQIRASLLDEIDKKGEYPKVIRIKNSHYYLTGNYPILLEDEDNTGESLTLMNNLQVITVRKNVDLDKLKAREKEGREKRRAEEDRENGISDMIP